MKGEGRRRKEKKQTDNFSSVNKLIKRAILERSEILLLDKSKDSKSYNLSKLDTSRAGESRRLFARERIFNLFTLLKSM